MTDKPLHVRVAEVLGWPDGKVPEWFRKIPWDDEEHYPRYDTSWAATGPLIERFGINIDLRADGNWWASCFGVPPGLPHLADPQDAPTPLKAVCNLLLKLPKEAYDHPDPV